MSARPEIIAEVGRWIEKAEHDLRNAEYVLTMEDDCPFDTVCFHCQQCAEKYLKGLLVLHDIQFSKTHDLRRILDLVKENTAVDLSPRTVVPLNRYSIEGRYPGDWEPITEEEARAAICMARAVREAVRKHVPNEILNSGN